MADELPSEEEALEEISANEYETHLDELEGDLPAFERELKRIEEKQDRGKGDDKGRSQ
jgi:hypothetical protein